MNMHWQILREVSRLKREVQKLTATEDRMLTKRSVRNIEELFESFKAGSLMGEDWGKEDATDTQLERLVRCHDKLSKSNRRPNWDQYFVEDGGSHQGCKAWLAHVIEPGVEADEFWESAIGTFWEVCVRKHNFLLGFCQGAIRVGRKR